MCKVLTFIYATIHDCSCLQVHVHVHEVEKTASWCVHKGTAVPSFFFPILSPAQMLSLPVCVWQWQALAAVCLAGGGNPTLPLHTRCAQITADIFREERV